MQTPLDPKDFIRDRALALGFDVVGFSGADNGDAGRHLKSYIESGFHGDMGWMASTENRRRSPRELWSDVETIVAVGVNYGPAEDPLAIKKFTDRGAVSVYARGKDYHDILRKKLRRLATDIAKDCSCEVKLFVDTAPVMEKPVAQVAGIGWQGKHTNLVSRNFGSWLFLGEVFTTLKIPPDTAGQDQCGACHRCLDVCPTNAFPAPYRLDATRCISYLTIEHKGHIPLQFRAAIGNRIYGCDDCLAVCPWNKFARVTQHGELRSHIHLTRPLLRDLMSLDEESFREVFSGSPIKRLGRNRFIRNVLIAVGNSADRALLADTEKSLADMSPLVRSMAVWALFRLATTTEFSQFREKYACMETDVDVLLEWDNGL
ncbi:MAG: Epoxyqueuosine reductase [Alphaproteobacteria bacterium MarineAlpha11_Bin1]|nr:MAG: Epoxyqueuosine reductase [Alphaproteobacteria bacterium MarineAlpha11_Bin1]|tara:strand:+ start:3372 stop:4493 length:1122 start_codon:yes stop_codon:yes gene_type:complete